MKKLTFLLLATLIFSCKPCEEKLLSEKQNISDTYLYSMFIQKLIHKNEKASGIIKFHHQLEQLKNIFSLATDMTCSQTL